MESTHPCQEQRSLPRHFLMGCAGISTRETQHSLQLKILFLRRRGRFVLGDRENILKWKTNTGQKQNAIPHASACRKLRQPSQRRPNFV